MTSQERHCVCNQRQLVCLFSILFTRRTKKQRTVLLSLCEGNLRPTGIRRNINAIMTSKRRRFHIIMTVLLRRVSAVQMSGGSPHKGPGNAENGSMSWLYHALPKKGRNSHKHWHSALGHNGAKHLDMIYPHVRLTPLTGMIHDNHTRHNERWFIWRGSEHIKAEIKWPPFCIRHFLNYFFIFLHENF